MSELLAALDQQRLSSASVTGHISRLAAAIAPLADLLEIGRTTSTPEKVIPVEEEPARGSLDDALAIRAVLVKSIKRSGKSRAAIAEEMEYLLARTVTDAMLNAFTADREDRRWPAEFDRAFCKATGDNSLLACRAEMAGLHVINDEERDLMELGRQFLLRSQADEQIALLQRRLHGRVA